MSIPFFLAVNGDAKINKTRVVESVIIGGILSAGGYFVALPVLSEKVDTINRAITRLEQRVVAVEARIEARRSVRDDQMDAIKKDISDVKINQAMRK